MTKILGIGTDIIEVERVRGVLTRHPENFPSKHFTPAEQSYCNGYREPAERYAGRFAGKEAVAKALGTGFGEHLAFIDIEIHNSPEGKPYVQLSGNAKEHYGDLEILLSISHCKEYATATAIVMQTFP